MKIRKYFLFYITIYVYSNVYATQSTIDDINKNLYQDIVALQVGSPTWIKLHNEFSHIKPIVGTFDTYTHINFTTLNSNADAIQARIMRRNPLNYSTNIFVTFLTLENLFEASSLNIKLPLDSTFVSSAVNAASIYRDFNHPNLDAFNFSPQVYNSKYNWWLPKEDLTEVSYQLYLISLTNLDLCKLIRNSSCEKAANANFQQPDYIMQDVDDTSMNLIIGSYLLSTNNQFVNATNIWRNNNNSQKIANTIKFILDNSYQPNSTDFNNNFTSSISYYMLQFYPQFDSSLFINTWITNFTEVKSLVQKNPNSIPIVVFVPNYNSNNVDAIVNVRFIIALARLLNNLELGEQILTDLPPSDQIKLQQVTISLTNWFVWLIENHFDVIHPDIISQYYPQATTLISLLAKLDNYLGSINLPDYNYWSLVKNKLDSALQNYSTSQLLNSVQTNQGLSYWDDFLGKADQNDNYHDDRLDTTALNVNSLLDIWTVKLANNQLKWNSNTPNIVKSIISQSINYLSLNALSTDDIRDNAVFSGGSPLSATEYYFNYDYFIDGSKYNVGDEPDNRRVLGVSGVVNNSTYNDWLILNQNKLKFNSFNYSQIIYWDSYAVTDSLIILALSKYQNLVQSIQ